MTTAQAMHLHNHAAGEDVPSYSPQEQEEIRAKMERVVAAKSDRAAANVIRWWGCWDRGYTATAFARRVREEWWRMNKTA